MVDFKNLNRRIDLRNRWAAMPPSVKDEWNLVAGALKDNLDALERFVNLITDIVELRLQRPPVNRGTVSFAWTPPGGDGRAMSRPHGCFSIIAKLNDLPGEFRVDMLPDKPVSGDELRHVEQLVQRPLDVR